MTEDMVALMAKFNAMLEWMMEQLKKDELAEQDDELAPELTAGFMPFYFFARSEGLDHETSKTYAYAIFRAALIQVEVENGQERIDKAKHQVELMTAAGMANTKVKQLQKHLDAMVARFEKFKRIAAGGTE